MLAEKAKPIVDDIAKKLGSGDGAVHADETYWTLNGQRAYYWVHCDATYVHFQFDTSRSGPVSRDVLGAHFTGMLVTDCYAGYEAHIAGAKQKCQSHLARTARDWQKLTEDVCLRQTMRPNERCVPWSFFARLRLVIAVMRVPCEWLG